MPTNHQPVAILCGDIHLSHKPPLARSVEPDWYASMEWGLKQLKDLQNELEVPILCAGDLFDKWNSPPELINFAIAKLPYMLAIPGQHDLPFHSLANIKKSAFWTLVEAGAIEYLPPGEAVNVENLCVACGFPFGVEPRKMDIQTKLVKILVAHKYVWCKRWGHPHASPEDEVVNFAQQLSSWNVAHFGDNHEGFMTGVGGCRVVNCGSFFRRRADTDHRPFVGIVYSNGTVQKKWLDCADDLFIERDKLIEAVGSIPGFADLLETMNASTGHLDFLQALSSFIKSNKVCREVAMMLSDIMEEARK